MKCLARNFSVMVLPFFKWVKRLSQSSNPIRPGFEPAKCPQKFTQHRHVVKHLTECIYFSSQTAFDQFPREFGGPSNNMTGPTKIGGRHSNNIPQTAPAHARCISLRSSRPARQGHGPARVIQLQGRRILQLSGFPPRLHSLRQIIVSVAIAPR